MSNNVPVTEVEDDIVVVSDTEGMNYSSVEFSCLAKVNDVSVIRDILNHANSEGFVGVAIRYVGGRWVWLEFSSSKQMLKFKDSERMKSLFAEFREVSPDERCVWVDIVGLPLAAWAPQVFMKLGSRWGVSVAVDMDSDGPLAHGKVCVMGRIQDLIKVSFQDRVFSVHASEFAYWSPEFENSEGNSSGDSQDKSDLGGSDNDEESLEEGECSKNGEFSGTMSEEVSSTIRLMNEVDTRGDEEVDPVTEKVMNGSHPLDGEVETNNIFVSKEVPDFDVRVDNHNKKVDVNEKEVSVGICKESDEIDFNICKESSDVSAPHHVENGSVYSVKNQNAGEELDNVEQNEVVKEDNCFEDGAASVVGDNINSSERSVHHNNGLDDHDVFLLNRLLHQDKCRVRPIKVAASSDLKIAEESSSTWLDYVGPLLIDELDPAICWSYKDPSGNVQGPFSLAQLHTWKDYFSSDFEIWRYYGSVKETVFLHSALKRRTKDVG